MRKLTRDEAEALPSRTLGKVSLAREYLMKMEVGDIILLEPKDWHQKHNKPNELIRRMRKQVKRNYSCQTVLDGSGWIITRLDDIVRRR